jgi:hypothetical protein
MNEQQSSLHAWVEQLGTELGIRADEFDVDAVLDLARDAAHYIERPAAPLTTFMAGYAAALRGGGRAEVDATVAAASALAQRQQAEGSR